MTTAWSTIDFLGKSADLFLNEEKSRWGMIFLHDSDERTLRENPIYSPLLEEFQIACLCLSGKQSWWSDRPNPNFDSQWTGEGYVLETVRLLQTSSFKQFFPISRLAIVGFGMGGQGSLRIAFKYPEIFPIVAGLGSTIDHYELYGLGTDLDEMYSSKEQCRQDSATMHIHPVKQSRHIWFAIDPRNCSWFRGNDRLHEKLSALGVSHTVDFRTSIPGDFWNYYHFMAKPLLQFLRLSLEQESRRLI